MLITTAFPLDEIVMVRLLGVSDAVAGLKVTVKLIPQCMLFFLSGRVESCTVSVLVVVHILRQLHWAFVSLEHVLLNIA